MREYIKGERESESEYVKKIKVSERELTISSFLKCLIMHKYVHVFIILKACVYIIS